MRAGAVLTDSELAVVREVLIRGPIPRRDLAARVGLSSPSLTRLVTPFLASGLLVETSEPDSGTVGRPTRPLAVRPDWGRFAGVKITGDRLHCVVTDGRAAPLVTADEALISHGPEQVADQLAAFLRRITGEIDALGVSVGGVVADGLVVDGVFLGWRDVDFGALMAARLGIPVVTENDVVALAEMQRWFGAGLSTSGFALITIGVGVGYGLVVDGRVVSSREAGAGLAAHVRLLENGPECELGHRGCADSLLTSRSIEGRYSALTTRSWTADEVLEAAARGDEAARQVTGESALALGRFIALAANLSLQSTVVLAGDGIGLWALEGDRMREAASADRGPGADAIHIEVDTSGFAAWARGAAVVAIQHTLRCGRGMTGVV